MPLIIGGVVAVVVVAWFVNDDRDAAAKVRDGKPVGPLTLRGLEVVALRADRAEVMPADPKDVGSDLFNLLRERDQAEPLMYLGRSGGSLVLYDSRDNTSWQIPASMFAVQTVNCEKNVERGGIDGTTRPSPELRVGLNRFGDHEAA